MLRAVALAALVLALGAGAAPTQAAPPSAAWPADGSSVEYALRSSASAPDGSYSSVTEATLRLTYSAGAWQGTCSGLTTTEVDGATTEQAFSVATQTAPPMMLERVHRGEAVDPSLTAAQPAGCRQDEGALVVQGPAMRAESGSPRKVKVWVAQEAPSATPYLDAMVTWNERTGLVLEWSHAGSGGGFQGRLVRTT